MINSVWDFEEKVSEDIIHDEENELIEESIIAYGIISKYKEVIYPHRFFKITRSSNNNLVDFIMFDPCFNFLEYHNLPRCSNECKILDSIRDQKYHMNLAIENNKTGNNYQLLSKKEHTLITKKHTIDYNCLFKYMQEPSNTSIN
jgi:hypothetical protein